MEEFVHRENLALLRKKLAESQDEAQRNVILKLLADEEKKHSSQPKKIRCGSPGGLFQTTQALFE
jgi:hypothetical protein